MLSDLLSENDIELPIIYSEHLSRDRQEMFEHAAKLNFESIVPKNSAARIERRGLSLAVNQSRPEGQISRHRVRERPYWRCRALPRQAGRQGSGLHGQGRDRMVPHRLKPNS